MRVLILGVGDAFTRRHFGTAALVEAPGGPVLVDCPDPVHRVLAEATAAAGWTVEAHQIGDVVLTHLHGDHCNGLESLGFWQFFARQRGVIDRRPRLHTHPQAAARLWARLAPAMDGGGRRGLADFYDLHVIDPGAPATVAGLTVECRLTGHPIPTAGLLASDGTGTLGWSGDTPYEAAHVEWLSRADLIVHECNLGPAHTPIEALNRLPDALRSRMRLVHLPDDFDASTTDIAILREGDVLEVTGRR